MFVCIHFTQKESWQPKGTAIVIYTNFFSTQQEQKGIVLFNNKIVTTTQACLTKINKGGIRN